MGVVVRRYIDILIILLIPTPLVLVLFLAVASILLCSFLKCFCSYCKYNRTVLEPNYCNM